MGADTGKQIKKIGLAIATGFTSEIKTGGGQYGDETVADTIFPKFINDWALEDRQNARGATDAAAQAEKDAVDAAKPGAPPDLADMLLRRKQKVTADANGRASTFLTGPSGTPQTKTLLGG